MKTIEIDECIKRIRSYAMQFEAEGKRNISEDLWVAVDFLNQQETKCFDCTRREWYMKGYQDGLKADKWIPCEERLPNKGDVILAQYHGWNGFDKIVIAYIRDDDEWKIDFGGVCNQNSIIAWQPLPQPYKKEGAENE